MTSIEKLHVGLQLWMPMMDALPEELQLHVFEFLDNLPPSELKVRHEPSLELTKSSQHDLKNISYVSKRWRRIALPSLFKHACLRLDINPRPEWEQCNACGKHPGRRECHRYHTEMLEAMNKFVTSANMVSFSPSDNVVYRSYEFATAVWANRMYHALEDFLQFCLLNSLASAVETFVLVSDRMLAGKAGRFPHESGQGEWRYPASAAFWRHLLSHIRPKRIATVAPPIELACIMNASIDTFGDWAFTDMDYHILEFKLEDSRNNETLTKELAYEYLDSIPSVHPGFAESCLLNLLPWMHVGLNEGSFLKAYGTYEFFERGPPSLVYSIGQALTLRMQRPIWPRVAAPAERFPASLRSFTYTGIFPFSNHADFRMILPHLEELDLQFAPDPQSSILDDKERTGKAELQDCWQELVSAYHDIAMTIGTFQMGRFKFPKLKRFICRDVKILALQEDLDHIFTPLCLPVWGEFERGVFTRLAISPPDEIAAS